MTHLPAKRSMQIVILFGIFGLYFILLLETRSSIKSISNFISDERTRNSDKIILVHYNDNITSVNWRNLTKEQIDSLSELGKILYLGHDYPKLNASVKNYTILTWNSQHGVQFFDDFDPLKSCPVKNCKISYEDEDFEFANMVVFDLRRMEKVHELPKGKRNSKQIWTMLIDKATFNNLTQIKNKLKNYNGIFNWTMSYRMDSEIPVPRGRTVPVKPGEPTEIESFDTWNKNKNQNVLIAIADLNCNESDKHWKYVKELKKYIAVVIYGRCGDTKCLESSTKDCSLLSQYKFYLAFEDSNCDEYLTEKLWLNTYAKNAVPIVMGATNKFYKQLLPPTSYISTVDFSTPQDLAEYVLHLNNTPNELDSYFEWKKRFKVLNEFTEYLETDAINYCRICEALNYNSMKKRVYNDLETYWNKNYC
ncbi:hypothetical protein ILUMI_02451 [Ignelater luminosus]|uniref:Fucosyltransferase n=1 Tax=Ignelater luminosus TaxID=2038154 RepID=A0A8K0DCR2_IGNLU|nr:hypothetical protein ILUMI_02451 [Ignelater luminosus]